MNFNLLRRVALLEHGHDATNKPVRTIVRSIIDREGRQIIGYYDRLTQSKWYKGESETLGQLIERIRAGQGGGLVALLEVYYGDTG